MGQYASRDLPTTFVETSSCCISLDRREDLRQYTAAAAAAAEATLWFMSCLCNQLLFFFFLLWTICNIHNNTGHFTKRLAENKLLSQKYLFCQ